MVCLCSSAVYAKLCSQGLKYKNTKTHTTWCTLSSLSQPTNQTFSLLVGMVLRLERTSLTQRPVLVDADRVRRIPASIAVELDHSLQCVCVCVCVLLYACVCYCICVFAIVCLHAGECVCSIKVDDIHETTTSGHAQFPPVMLHMS